jgi:UDP-N-acetyl-D-mannosaminuronate dehydrogenase
MAPRIGLTGLGYVGLPLGLPFAEKFPDTVGLHLCATKVGLIQEAKAPCEDDSSRDVISF